jgi:hypothetical protein
MTKYDWQDWSEYGDDAPADDVDLDKFEPFDDDLWRDEDED